MNASVRLRLWALLAVCVYLWMFSVALAAEQGPVTRSGAGFAAERAGAERRDPASLQILDAAAAGKIARQDTPGLARKHAGPCCAYRIYDAQTRLFDDFDADGHYTYLRVTFDIDTDYFEADVFVRLFLKGSDNRWTMIYESGVFPIFGSSATDDYEVETELVSGFARDHYDVLIEVYEAPFGELVLEYGPLENPALGFLPMEDLAADSVVPPPVAISSGGGGGALTYELLMLLVLAGWTGLRHRWRDR